MILRQILFYTLFLVPFLWAQELTSTSMNSGSLNAKIKNGGITSTIGEAIVGDLGQVSSGFQQPFLQYSGPVELLAVKQYSSHSWNQLLQTGHSIQILDLHGRSVLHLPAGLSLHELQGLVMQLPLGTYVFASSSSTQSVRFVAINSFQ